MWYTFCTYIVYTIPIVVSIIIFDSHIKLGTFSTYKKVCKKRNELKSNIDTLNDVECGILTVHA